MRRFLDDDAWQAGEARAVLVLGRVRPETLAALKLWAGGQRAAEVAPAPISAVLRDAAVREGERDPSTGADADG